MPSRRVNIGIAVAFLAAAAGAMLYVSRPKPIAVAVAVAEPGRVETTVANTRAGSVTACRRAKVAPPAGGRIDRLPVKKGDRVKAGDLLLELWNDDLSARERISHEQLETAHARVTEVCQLADAAASDARRTRELRTRSFVSDQSVVRAEADAASKAAACVSARAQVKEGQARIVASRADTQRTILRAPFAGIVAEINGEIGEYLTPSPPGIPTLPAIDLIDDTCLYVTAPIDEVDAALIAVGMKGRIALDAYRGKHFDGRVRRIAPYVLALEKQARTVEIEVAFDDPAQARNLLVGYSADVEVVVQGKDEVLRIPTPALMPGNRVLVLADTGRLEERKLDIGLSNWEYTEVKSGLERGMRIVTSLDREGVKAGAHATVDNKAAGTPKK